MNRVILHCDLNNFYASVECLYNPDLRDKPVAVCGSQSTRHGIVLAKNQIAKKMGVKTAQAVWEARNQCPGLVVVPPNYSLYLRFSIAAREIYKYYTDQVEAFGIDEYWLDVTGSTKLFGDGEKIAHEIRERMIDELGLTISVGVSFNKIFAKLGSDMKKPNAVTTVYENEVKKKVWPLPVDELLYVGRQTGKKLNSVGICTIGDLACTSPAFIKGMLGKWGETLWCFANGYDETPVHKNGYQSIVKGVGNSLTTPRDLIDNEEVKILIYVLAESVGERLRSHNLKGRTVQVGIKDSKLSYVERQAKLDYYTYTTSEIAEKAYEIFLNTWDWSKTIRAVGVRVTDLVEADQYVQLSLLYDNRREKRERVDHCIDKLRERFGHYSVQRAFILKDDSLNANPVEENVIHPVSYFR